MLRRLFLILAALVIAYSLWWHFGRSPERQIAAAQETFLEAVEDQAWEEVQEMLAADFIGPGGLNRETVMAELQKALGGFVTLDIEAREPSIQAARELGVSTQTIRVTGLGNAYAIMVRDRANQIQPPWLLHWRKTGRWPWNWQLTQVHNDGI